MHARMSKHTLVVTNHSRRVPCGHARRKAPDTPGVLAAARRTTKWRAHIGPNTSALLADAPRTRTPEAYDSSKLTLPAPRPSACLAHIFDGLQPTTRHDPSSIVGTRTKWSTPRGGGEKKGRHQGGCPPKKVDTKGRTTQNQSTPNSVPRIPCRKSKGALNVKGLFLPVTASRSGCFIAGTDTPISTSVIESRSTTLCTISSDVERRPQTATHLQSMWSKRFSN